MLPDAAWMDAPEAAADSLTQPDHFPRRKGRVVLPVQLTTQVRAGPPTPVSAAVLVKVFTRPPEPSSARMATRNGFATPCAPRVSKTSVVNGRIDSVCE